MADRLLRELPRGDVAIDLEHVVVPIGHADQRHPALDGDPAIVRGPMPQFARPPAVPPQGRLAVVPAIGELRVQQLVADPSHRLRRVEAVELAGAWIPGADPSAQLPDQDRVERLIQQPRELLQGQRGPPAFGDVAGDPRGPDEPARPVPDRRDRQREVDPAAVLGDPHRLVGLDPFAPRIRSMISGPSCCRPGGNKRRPGRPMISSAR